VGLLDQSYFDKDMFSCMFGVYVAERRQDLRLSSEELSERAGIPLTRLRKIEAGRLEFRPKTFEALDRVLDFDEQRLEKMGKVARVGFIGELMDLIWAERQSTEAAP
jgi:ribosome-binding protein aMBF1 (putative translation factor)